MDSPEKIKRHVDNRTKLLGAVVGEVFGPGSSFDVRDEAILGKGTHVDLSKAITYPTWEEYYKIRPVVAATGEEILRDERPSSRYGRGILFPDALEVGATDEIEEKATSEAQPSGVSSEVVAASGEDAKLTASMGDLEARRQK